MNINQSVSQDQLTSGKVCGYISLLERSTVDRSSDKSQLSRVLGPTFLRIFLLYGYVEGHIIFHGLTLTFTFVS